ncbi:MAG: ATP-binding protein, partial [Clostridia bacterium]
IIDDFGLRDFTPLQAEDFYELVCERYRSGSLMVVSNRTPKDWYALFPNPVLAEGALDRLINSSHYVMMEGKSYRPLRRPDRRPAGSDPSSSSFPVDKEEVTTGS